MYTKKYWGNFIGGSDDSLNLVAFLEDQKKEEISLSEIFTKIGLDKQNWDFHQTVEYLEFTHSNGVEMDFHFAIDVVTDLAAILLECSVSGSVNLQDLDEYNTPARRVRITATPEEHDAMNKALADFAHDPLSYDLHEMMDDEEIQEMAWDVEALRKELYEAAGRKALLDKVSRGRNLPPVWAAFFMAGENPGEMEAICSSFLPLLILCRPLLWLSALAWACGALSICWRATVPTTRAPKARV